MEEVVDKLKKELADTKKELGWYKDQHEEQQWNNIPQESISKKPIKSLLFGTGVSSRVRLHPITLVESLDNRQFFIASMMLLGYAMRKLGID